MLPLEIPFEEISLEMLYRGMYHFSVAYEKGLAVDIVKQLWLLDLRF
jgi:hypothetical protein